ncbi:MAG: AI-2E family transporter [Thermodesulfovibrionales bacterium]
MTDRPQRAGEDPAEAFRKIHHQMPRWVLVLLGAAAAAALASRTGPLLMTLLISGVIAYILSSLVNMAGSFGIRRGVAVGAIFIAAALSIVFADLMLGPSLESEIRNFYERIPEFTQKLETALASESVGESGATSVPEEAVRTLLSAAIGPGRLFDKAFNLSGIMNQAAPFLMALILIPFFVFFILKDWPVMLNSVMSWIPPAYVETSLAVISEVDILVGKYLRGLAVDCAAVGALAAAGLWALGIEYPISLGILTAAANVIPYFGVLISCSAASAFAFLQFGTLGAVLNIIVLYAVLRLLDDLVIQPLTVGKSVKLHPLLLVLTIIAGESLFGVSGMILGVPVVTASEKVIGILLDHRRAKSLRTAARPRAAGAPTALPVRPL